MIKLSVAIICRNEENSIGKCLESVKDADEIVVCDTGSEDKTIEIVKKYTDKIFSDYSWNDNFAEARNHAISKCTGDWILVIDADNVLVGGIKKTKEECEKADKSGYKTISLKIFWERTNKFSHYLPYLFKRDPEIYFKGAVHNYLTRDDKNYSDLALACWYSESHYKDPDRSFRILKKEVFSKPELRREKYYLAREYYSRGDYPNALWWFQEYLKMKSDFGGEVADAYLLMAKCYWQLQKGDFARAHCLEAIGINTNFKEAILFMAEMSGPINKDRWLEFAEGADNSGVLFTREKSEWTKEDYNKQFKADSDMSRYENIQKEIGQIVGNKSVLDIGCGTAELSKYIKNYKGFDFSEEAVKIANNPNVWVGNAYDKSNYKKADYYVATEVFEHLDDLKIIENIPKGQKAIFSVPSFDDPSHLRVFTEKIVRRRYKDLFDIQKITRFNWNSENRKWLKDYQDTREYILLCEAVKK